MRRALRHALAGSLALSVVACADSHAMTVDVRPDVARPDTGPCGPGMPCDCRAVDRVPMGEFWRGGPPNADAIGLHWSPPHRALHTRDYYLGRYEVTARCFRYCVELGACSEETIIRPEAWMYTLNSPPVDYWRDPFYDELPATQLTQRGASDVCAALGGRLPTGAEWEHAARSEDGRLYPWEPPPADPLRPTNAEQARGDDPTRWDYRAEGMLIDFVGRYPLGVGPYGHLDIYGNAAEWTSDGASESDEPYVGPFDTPLVDPAVPATGDLYAVRDWQRGPSYRWVAVDQSGELDPTAHFHNAEHAIGVRCLFETEPAPLIPDME